MVMRNLIPRMDLGSILKGLGTSPGAFRPYNYQGPLPAPTTGPVQAPHVYGQEPWMDPRYGAAGPPSFLNPESPAYIDPTERLRSLDRRISTARELEEAQRAAESITSGDVINEYLESPQTENDSRILEERLTDLYEQGGAGGFEARRRASGTVQQVQAQATEPQTADDLIRRQLREAPSDATWRAFERSEERRRQQLAPAVRQTLPADPNAPPAVRQTMEQPLGVAPSMELPPSAYLSSLGPGGERRVTEPPTVVTPGPRGEQQILSDARLKVRLGDPLTPEDIEVLTAYGEPPGSTTTLPPSAYLSSLGPGGESRITEPPTVITDSVRTPEDIMASAAAAGAAAGITQPPATTTTLPPSAYLSSLGPGGESQITEQPTITGGWGSPEALMDADQRRLEAQLQAETTTAGLQDLFNVAARQRGLSFLPTEFRRTIQSYAPQLQAQWRLQQALGQAPQQSYYDYLRGAQVAPRQDFRSLLGDASRQFSAMHTAGMDPSQWAASQGYTPERAEAWGSLFEQLSDPASAENLFRMAARPRGAFGGAFDRMRQAEFERRQIEDPASFDPGQAGSFVSQVQRAGW